MGAAKREPGPALPADGNSLSRNRKHAGSEGTTDQSVDVVAAGSFELRVAGESYECGLPGADGCVRRHAGRQAEAGREAETRSRFRFDNRYLCARRRPGYRTYRVSDVAATSYSRSNCVLQIPE